jgi:hypothetical protein
VAKRNLTDRAAFVAAILALGLLGFASVRSMVMQGVATASASQSRCADMAGMNGPGKGAVPAGKASKACVYCAAAAHVPVHASAIAVSGSMAVEWANYCAPHSTGALGPPAFTPKARGPPHVSLTT